MTLDDRLRTVLGVAVDGERAALAQYRQLVDLLGSGGTVADGQLVASAFLRLSVLSRRLPVAERVAILGEPGLRLRTASLVAQLCEGDERVAEAALNSAALDRDGWDAVVPMLANGLRRHAELLRLSAQAEAIASEPETSFEASEDNAAEGEDEVVIAEAAPTPAPETVSAPTAPKPEKRAAAGTNGWRGTPREVGAGDIAGLVQRIEEYREHRATRGTHHGPAGESAARTPQPAEITAAIIDCRIGPDARINWAGAMAPMLTGLAFSTAEDASARIEGRAASALRRQQVVRGGEVALSASPAITGKWRLDAVPRFDTVGRFLGHHARLTRKPEKKEEADTRGDTVRQALHELRTPLGAIQGFAEIIQQQLFGTVPNRYRAQAAEIAAESARLLAGLEEVERLVRMRKGDMAMPGGETALAAMLGQLVDQFAAIEQGHGAEFVLNAPGADVTIPLAEAEAETMLWRLLATLSAAAETGERIDITLEHGSRVHLAITLPESLREADLFSADVGQSERGEPVLGLLGAGFALRLAAAEVRAAGGSFAHDENHVRIALPMVEKLHAELRETAA